MRSSRNQLAEVELKEVYSRRYRPVCRAKKAFAMTCACDLLVAELTLALFYLTSWEERPVKGCPAFLKAWKSADWGAIDYLRDEGFIDCSNRAKSVDLLEKGAVEGRLLAERLRAALGHDREEEPAKDAADADGSEALPSAVAGASSGRSDLVPAFTIRLTFMFDDLACWREICVPQSFTFEDLHTAIQACLGWLNYHLYNFRFVSGGQEMQVSWPDLELGGEPEELAWMVGPSGRRRVWRDAASMRLDEVFPRTKKALYSYDYGDGWEIELRLVDAHATLEANVPCCLDGQGDNPPEDVGGEGGFEDFLRVIADPSDPKHEVMAAWGESQSFGHFDLDKTNERLSHYNDWRVKDVYASRA